jgi:hypothetical protein
VSTRTGRCGEQRGAADSERASERANVARYYVESRVTFARDSHGRRGDWVARFTLSEQPGINPLVRRLHVWAVAVIHSRTRD